MSIGFGFSPSDIITAAHFASELWEQITRRHRDSFPALVAFKKDLCALEQLVGDHVAAPVVHEKTFRHSMRDFGTALKHAETLRENHERTLKPAYMSALEQYMLTRDLKNVHAITNVVWYIGKGFLLDMGSQENFMSMGMVRQLGLENEYSAKIGLHRLPMNTDETIPQHWLHGYLGRSGQLSTSIQHPGQGDREQNTLLDDGSDLLQHPVGTELISTKEAAQCETRSQVESWESAFYSADVFIPRYSTEGHCCDGPTGYKSVDCWVTLGGHVYNIREEFRWTTRVLPSPLPWLPPIPKDPALEATFESIFCDITFALSTKRWKRLLFFSPLMFARSGNAYAFPPQEYATAGFQGSVLDYDTWVRAFHSQRALPSPWNIYLNRHLPESGLPPHPSTLLLACFLCTGSLALVTHIRRKDRYQSYVLAFSALAATIIGIVRTVNLQEFIFRYLFLGCLVGVVGSASLHWAVGEMDREEMKGPIRGEHGLDDHKHGVAGEEHQVRHPELEHAQTADEKPGSHKDA
ncbi:MAG: hypothetical protein Q9186_003126 [Xanthomendoza sp. 1 TL-2023]